MCACICGCEHVCVCMHVQCVHVCAYVFACIHLQFVYYMLACGVGVFLCVHMCVCFEPGFVCMKT